MFGDDFFGGGIDELFNKLAGGTMPRQYVNNNSTLLSISGNNSKKYFVFDLSGKSLESVKIEDDLEVNEYGEEVHNGQKTLKIVTGDGQSMKYILPKELRKRSLKHKLTNGILEATLEK
jgi:hypothetical protein